eukprot:12906877-Prorocentrum_lima.AAC.1
MSAACGVPMLGESCRYRRVVHLDIALVGHVQSAAIMPWFRHLAPLPSEESLRNRPASQRLAGDSSGVLG